jgi:hypothetical protein
MWMLALAQSVTTVCSQCFLIVSAHPLWAKFGTNSSVQQRPIKPEESSSPVGGARAREAHWRHLCSALIRRGGGGGVFNPFSYMDKKGSMAALFMLVGDISGQ